MIDKVLKDGYFRGQNLDYPKWVHVFKCTAVVKLE